MKAGFLAPIFLFVSAIVTFAMGTIFRLRLLPLLRPDSILSGGKQVSTEQFAHLMSKVFYVTGTATLVLAILMLVSLLRSRR
jgi:hypothetical protein